MLAELSDRQLAEWKYIYEYEPRGEERADKRMARLARAVYKANNWKVGDESAFMFDFHPQPVPPPTAREYKLKSMREFGRRGGVIET